MTGDAFKEAVRHRSRGAGFVPLDLIKRLTVIERNDLGVMTQSEARRRIVAYDTEQPPLPRAETPTTGLEVERLATQLEAAARSIRDAMKPPQRGVFLHQAKTGYTVCVDGFDLGLSTSWADADALCRAIATRRPPGDEMGYGRHYHAGTPFGSSSRDERNSTVTIGISVREQVEG